MITGVHAMFYTPEAEVLRTFFRDKLRIANFDAGDGWLIFTPNEGEVGFHPGEPKQEISLFCDDIAATVAELRSRGVEFTQEVQDWGFGWGTFIRAPAELRIQLYQPKYRTGAPNGTP